MRAPALHGGPLDRFLELEAAAGLGPGRALAAELRYLGGSRALASALRTFPQTTEQLLHVDKFLERERALPVRLPATAGGTSRRVRGLRRAQCPQPAAIVRRAGRGLGRSGLGRRPAGAL